MTEITKEAYNEKFKELTTAWLEGVDFKSVCLTEAELLQIAGEFQDEAFVSLEGDIDSFEEWSHYEASCDARGYFEDTIIELWSEEMERRKGLGY